VGDRHLKFHELRDNLTGRARRTSSAPGRTRLGTRCGRRTGEVLDRQCAPFPGARTPFWDGEHVLFAVEDRGRVHL